MVAGWFVLGDAPGIGLRAGADAIGALLVTSGLMLGVFAIAGTTRYGWGSPHTLLSGGGAVVLLAAFILRQRTARTPLLPLRVFGRRDVSVANAVQALTVEASGKEAVAVIDALETLLANRFGEDE